MQSHIEKSVEVLQLAAKMSKQYYNKPLVVCYSGGKDSDVLLHLACNCLEKHEFRVLNAHTTVDMPETVYHIRNTFKRLTDLGWDAKTQDSGTTMWKLISESKMPPTRIARYCCSVLKETSTPNQIAAVGVRAEESQGRKDRDAFWIRGKEKLYYSFDHAKEVYEDAQGKDEVWDCRLITSAKENKDLIVNPIYEWTHSDVWWYIRENGIKTNPLYGKGFYRVGCVLCPMATRKEKRRQMEMYPEYKRAYIRAFDKMLRNIKENARKGWDTGEDVFEWWIGTDQVKGQISIDEYLKAGV